MSHVLSRACAAVAACCALAVGLVCTADASAAAGGGEEARPGDGRRARQGVVLEVEAERAGEGRRVELGLVDADAAGDAAVLHVDGVLVTDPEADTR